MPLVSLGLLVTRSDAFFTLLLLLLLLLLSEAADFFLPSLPSPSLLMSMMRPMGHATANMMAIKIHEPMSLLLGLSPEALDWVLGWDFVCDLGGVAHGSSLREADCFFASAFSSVNFPLPS